MAQGSTRGVPIDTDGTLANNSDLLVPSQKAVKTYVDALTATDLGLWNVDNTSDLSKPISTATQTALNAKVDEVASTDNALVKFDWTGGAIQNTGVIIGDDNSITSGNFYLNLLANGVSIEGSAAAWGRADIYATGSDTNIDLYLDAQGTGVIKMQKDVTVPDEAYWVGWNGSLEVPTKNAIYDKIETISGGSPGGSDTYVQFNDGGSFGGEAAFAYNKTTNYLSVDHINTYDIFGINDLTLYGQSGGGTTYIIIWDTSGITFQWATGTYDFWKWGSSLYWKFDFSSLATSNKTFTFPNATGTISLIANTETLSNKTLTAPKFADLWYIADANGNELIIFDTVASAVNELTLANSATGGNPILTASGGDANIWFDFQAKGTGTYNFKGTASQQAEIRLFEDTDNGTDYIAIKAPAAVTSYTLTLPTNDGDANQVLTTDGSGTLSWATPSGWSVNPLAVMVFM